MATTPHIITLGTAGGPRWWGGEPDRVGISTAVVVGDRFYLVDAGYGAARQIARAGLSLRDMGGLFLTHLHSDHVVDLPALLVFGLYEMLQRVDAPVPVYGPGNRGILPPLSPYATGTPHIAHPQNPTPGTREMFEGIVGAFATDLNDRILDSLRPNPLDLYDLRDIVVPEDAGYHPDDAPSPDMEPFVVFEDDRVRVSAILVAHPPVAPAFAFRFDTDNGSVTISGDTREHENTVRLAEGTDLLLHEAIDFEWVESAYRGLSDEASQAAREHHYKSHTSVEGACRVAIAAGARRLALHHLVPGSADPSVWARGAERLPGRFLVPSDLDRIDLAHVAASAGRVSTAAGS